MMGRDNSTNLTSKCLSDWYQFTLNKKAHVSFEINQLITNSLSSIRLHDEAGKQLSGRNASNDESIFNEDLGALQAGTYYLNIVPRSSDAKTDYPGNRMVEQHNSAYEFRLMSIAAD